MLFIMVTTMRYPGNNWQWFLPKWQYLVMANDLDRVLTAVGPELLLPLAQAHGVPLDELIGPWATAGPRIHAEPTTRNGMTVLPLTRRSGGLQAYKLVIPASRGLHEPNLQVHEGYEWLYVLSGRLRLVLGEHDLVLQTGEAAEFDTRLPHWFDRAGVEPVELLSLFGPQGERMHVRARPKR